MKASLIFLSVASMTFERPTTNIAVAVVKPTNRMSLKVYDNDILNNLDDKQDDEDHVEHGKEYTIGHNDNQLDFDHNTEYEQEVYIGSDNQDDEDHVEHDTLAHNDRKLDDQDDDSDLYDEYDAELHND
jgi:hypothetical protein